MKVAILTRNANPWVYFVISRLTAGGVQVVVVNEVRPQRRPRWMSFRFMRRRGLFAFVDLFLQWSEAGLARARRSLFRHGKSSTPETGVREFDPTWPFRFRSSLTVLAEAGVADNPLVQWHDIEVVNSQPTIQLLKQNGVQHTLLCGAPLVSISLFRELGPLVNSHCGISPQYKGSSPIHWAAYNCDWDQIGFTLHIASSEVDGGPIIHQERHRPRRGWALTDLDWFLVYSMYDRLCELVIADRLAVLMTAAVKQERGFRSHPPMGLIRSRVASRRLARYLSTRSEKIEP